MCITIQDTLLSQFIDSMTLQFVMLYCVLPFIIITIIHTDVILECCLCFFQQDRNTSMMHFHLSFIVTAPTFTLLCIL